MGGEVGWGAGRSRPSKGTKLQKEDKDIGRMSPWGLEHSFRSKTPSLCRCVHSFPVISMFYKIFLQKKEKNDLHLMSILPERTSTGDHWNIY